MGEAFRKAYKKLTEESLNEDYTKEEREFVYEARDLAELERETSDPYTAQRLDISHEEALFEVDLFMERVGDANLSKEVVSEINEILKDAILKYKDFQRRERSKLELRKMFAQDMGRTTNDY